MALIFRFIVQKSSSLIAEVQIVKMNLAITPTKTHKVVIIQMQKFQRAKKSSHHNQSTEKNQILIVEQLQLWAIQHNLKIQQTLQKTCNNSFK